MYYHLLFSAEFFEECIKEEQYEAQKLDIMRDAVRAKVSYNVQSTEVEEAPISPREVSPIAEETHQNVASCTNGTNGTS